MNGPTRAVMAEAFIVISIVVVAVLFLDLFFVLFFDLFVSVSAIS